MDLNNERVNWNRLVITVLLIVIASAITSSITWFLLDRAFNESANASAQTINELERKVTFLVGQLADTNADGTINYSNTNYDFKLVLPSDWNRYKVLTQKVVGSQIVLHFELPTSDPGFTKASSTNDAGYASLFSIVIYSKADWSALGTQTTITKIVEDSKYVFGYGHAQTTPSDLASQNAEVNAIINSFKLN